jgi:hypothetical protein
MIENIADLKDPNDPAGRSYRQVNAEKAHGIALGALVELERGARLFVVMLGRDCDQTPLYWLAPSILEATEEEEPAYYRYHRTKWVGGYDEESLTVIHEVPSAVPRFRCTNCKGRGWVNEPHGDGMGISQVACPKCTSTEEREK